MIKRYILLNTDYVVYILCILKNDAKEFDWIVIINWKIKFK